MAEGKAMADKIFRSMENIISIDSELCEFSIVLSEENSKNKSPILYEEHHLGLESWCVKHIYNYACSVLFDHRQLLLRKKLPYYDKVENVNYLLVGVILINPDVATFWNMKRELVEFGVLNVEKELFFSKIVLSSKSKSNEAFSYRRWLIKRMCRKNTDNTIPLLTLLQNELMVTHMASEKSSNNYHSWNHRIWCIENMASSSPNIGNIVYSELSYSQEWINSHVSEHSGYHYRQYLITLVKDHKNIDSLFDSYYNFALKHFNLFDQGEYSHSQLLIYLMGNQKKVGLLEKTYSYINYSSLLLHDLFVLIDKLDSFYPEHESLFYHRRFVVYHLVKFVYEYQGAEFPIRNEVTGCHGNPINNNTVKNDISMSKKKSNGNIKCHRPKLFHPDQNKKEIGNLYRIILESEKQFLSENLCITSSAVQNNLLRRYQRWLKYMIGIE